MVKASKNELTSLFKQAFEGMGYDFGGYESAADMIVWAQMHGLNSFEKIRKRLPTIVQDKRESVAQCRVTSDGELVIDAKANSSIAVAAMALDIAYVEAIKSEVACVSVLNCYDRNLVVKKLVDCALRGMLCLAYWHDGEVLHWVTSDTGVCCPEYAKYPLKNWPEAKFLQGKDQQSLFVVCAKNKPALEAYITQYLPRLNEMSPIIMLPKMMKSSYLEALTNGIEIDNDFWKELATIGLKVLVESTEQSRMGAGAS